MIKKIKTAFFLFIPHISLSNIAIMFVFKSQVHLLVMNHFSLLMTFVIAIGLIFPFPNLTDAHKGTEEFHDCECGNKEVVEKPEGFEILEENKVRQAYSSLHNESEFKKAIKWLKDEGLKINPKTGAGIEMDSLILKINGRKFQQVDHYAWRADSKDKYRPPSSK